MEYGSLCNIFSLPVMRVKNPGMHSAHEWKFTYVKVSLYSSALVTFFLIYDRQGI